MTETQFITPETLSGDEIRVENVVSDVIIGILSHERLTPQSLITSVTMVLDTEQAAITGDLATSVDYAQLTQAVRFILEAGRFRLLESAAVALARFVLVAMPVVTQVRISLTKPKALSGNGIPQVSVARKRAIPSQHFTDNDVADLFSCPGTSLRLLKGPSSAHLSSAKTDHGLEVAHHQNCFFPLANTVTLAVTSQEI